MLFRVVELDRLAGNEMGCRGHLISYKHQLLGPSGTGLDTTTGPDVSARTAGLDVATHVGGVEARPIRVPQSTLDAQQLQQSPETQLHTSPLASQHTVTQQLEQPLQRPSMSPQPSTISTHPSPSQYPEPQQIPQPVQVMRTWTTQMASAAAAMGQRFQIQTVLGQGQVEVREGDVPAGSDGLMGFGLGDQGYPGYLQQEPPPLPQHLRNDNGGGPSRSSVFAGIARAGQALRRRVLSPVFQQVSGYSQVPPSFSVLEGNSEVLLGSTPASSMWKSDMWSSFRQEYHVPMMQVETPENGDNYLIATNLAMKGGLLALDSVEVPEGLATKVWPNIWKRPFQNEVGLAVDRWRIRPDEMFLGHMLHKLDSDSPWSEKDFRYWRRHVANGHLPFDRRCRTCVQTAATGRAHRRVIAPSCYTLSLDVCGPFRVKGEYGGSKGFRYALIGTYLMPKLDGYKDAPIPEEPDIASVLGDQEEDFLEEQGPPEPPLDPEDQEDLDKSNKRFQDLYKEVGDAMEYQTLHFAIPIKTRLTPEVEDAVKSIYLQIRAEGLPVTRVHSDRARELRGSKLRSWLLHRDVLPTTGEAQAPQTNGRAEAGPRFAPRPFFEQLVWTHAVGPLLCPLRLSSSVSVL